LKTQTWAKTEHTLSEWYLHVPTWGIHIWMQQPMWIKQSIPPQRRVHYASEIGIEMAHTY
jgi:hypothetical protein